MSCDVVRVGDIGTVFQVTLKDCGTVVNISGASTLEMIFVKPDGTKLTKTASLVTDGTDGKLKYTTISGDIDTAGVWVRQCHVVIAAGEFYSSIDSFTVMANL